MQRFWQRLALGAFSILVLIVQSPLWYFNQISAQTTIKTITYAPSDDPFPNPERGLFRQILSDSASPSLPSSKTFSDLKRDRMTLVRYIFSMTTFRNSPISSQYLQHIQDTFNLARDNGIKLIVRFCYTFNEPGPHTDAPLSVVLSHIDQLAPLLQKNTDVIATLDAGFIGRWGEGHSSSNDLDKPDNMRKIVTKLLTAVPKERMVAVRYQVQKKEIFNNLNPLTPTEAFTGSDRSRVGAHNDCFLAGYEDWGTYKGPPWPVPAHMIDEQKEWLHKDNRFVPQTGETCNLNPPRSECETALVELERMRWSAINEDFEPSVIDSWRNGGCFPAIENRLGYRFRLLKSRLPARATAGDKFAVSFDITNDGYASTYNRRDVQIILRNTLNGFKHVIPVTNADPRRWLPDEDHYTIEASTILPTDLPSGTYDVLLNLPDPEPTLSTRPDYSIRLANKDLWEPKTGYNSMQHQLQVSTSLPPLATFTLQLSAGWNLISFPLSPQDNRVEQVLQTLQGRYSAIYSFDTKTAKYLGYQPSVGSGDLKSIDAGKGYWIYMESSAELRISGTAAPAPIQIAKGWNLVGFISLSAVPARTALQSIANQSILVYGYDNLSRAYNSYDPTGLSEMKPGSGYWIYADHNLIWTLK
jgi:hypothetical protein